MRNPTQSGVVQGSPGYLGGTEWYTRYSRSASGYSQRDGTLQSTRGMPRGARRHARGTLGVLSRTLGRPVEYAVILPVLQSQSRGAQKLHRRISRGYSRVLTSAPACALLRSLWKGRLRSRACSPARTHVCVCARACARVDRLCACASAAVVPSCGTAGTCGIYSSARDDAGGRVRGCRSV